MAVDDRVTDAFLRHQLRLDGLATSAVAEILEDVKKALSEVNARLRQAGRGTFTEARLRSFRTGLWDLEARLQVRLSHVISNAVEGAALSAAGVAAEAAQELVVGAVEPPLDVLREVAAQPFRGRSWQAWGEKLAGDVLARVQSELRQGLAIGEGIPDLSRRVSGVAGIARSRAEIIVRTAVTDVGNRARIAAAEAEFAA